MGSSLQSKLNATTSIAGTLKNERDTLKEEIDLLNNKVVEKLKSDISNLMNQAEEYKKKISTLSSAMDGNKKESMTQETDELKKTIDELIQVYQRLEEDNKKSEKKSEHLKSQNKELMKDLKFLSKEQVASEQKYLTAKEDNEKLRKQLKAWNIPEGGANKPPDEGGGKPGGMILLSGGVGSAGGASSGDFENKYTTLLDEHKGTLRNVEFLLSELDEMKKKKSSLQNDFDEVVVKNTTLQLEIDKTRSEMENIQSKLETAQIEQKTSSRYDAREMKRYLTEIESLTEEIDAK